MKNKRTILGLVVMMGFLIVLGSISMLPFARGDNLVGEPVDAFGNGELITDYWNITTDNYVFDGHGHNVTVNQFMSVNASNVMITNVSSMLIEYLQINQTNASLTLSNGYYDIGFLQLNGTLTIQNATVNFTKMTFGTYPDYNITLNVINSTVYNLSMPSAGIFYGEGMPLNMPPNSTIYISNSNVKLDGYGSYANIRWYGFNDTIDITIEDSIIWADNELVAFQIGVPIFDGSGNLVNVTKTNYHFNNTVFKNISIEFAQDVNLYNCDFETSMLIDNMTEMSNYVGSALTHIPTTVNIMLNPFMDTVDIENVAINDTLYAVVITAIPSIYAIHNLNNTTIEMKDNRITNAIGGIIFYIGEELSTGDPTPLYTLTNITIEHNTFNGVGKNTGKVLELMDYIDPVMPLAVGFEMPNATLNNMQIIKNNFGNSLTALYLHNDYNSSGDINIHYNYFHHYSVGIVAIITNNTTMSYDHNWWFRDGFNASNISYMYINSTDALGDVMVDVLQNGTVYDIISNQNFTTIPAIMPYPANYKVIKVNAKRGWNFIGLPFNVNMNLTQFFQQNPDVKAIVIITEDRKYIPVVPEIASFITYDISWQGFYVFMKNNTTLNFNNPSAELKYKFTLKQGWNTVPYTPLAEGDHFLQRLKDSGITKVVYRSPEGNYTILQLNITPSDIINETEANLTVGQPLYVFADTETTIAIYEYTLKELFPDEEF